jgi:hypothetical protein
VPNVTVACVPPVTIAVTLCDQLNAEGAIVTYRMPFTLFTPNCVPTGCAMFWLAEGVVDTFPVPLPPPHVPHVPFPNRQLPEVAVPDPNSLTGTRPENKSALLAAPVSTYCFVAACKLDVGFPGRVTGPVNVPPASER